MLIGVYALSKYYGIYYEDYQLKSSWDLSLLSREHVEKSIDCQRGKREFLGQQLKYYPVK